MSFAPAASNRVLLSILGLVLLLGGGWWILVILELPHRFGVWQPDPRGPVASLPELASGPVGAGVLVALGILLIAIGAWLALRQIPTRGAPRSFGYAGGQAHGATSVDTSALASAIADDANALAGVNGAKAILHGAAVRPELLLEVVIDHRGSIPEALAEIERTVLRNAEHAIGTPLAHVGVRVRTGENTTSNKEVVV